MYVDGKNLHKVDVGGVMQLHEMEKDKKKRTVSAHY